MTAIQKNYPILNRLLVSENDIIINEELKKTISDELLKELKQFTGYRTYERILAVYEGNTIKELIENTI